MNRVLTGRGVLLWLFLFFGVVIVTNVFFITVAVKTFRGEDEAKPYLQGIAYNQTLARRAEQAELGWHAFIAAERSGDKGAVVDLDVVDANGAPKAGLVLTGELHHPSDEYRDRPIRFRELSPGHYRSEVENVRPGDWDVIARTEQGTPFEASRRLWVP
jgi:nitrogen fixation protein FixH